MRARPLPAGVSALPGPVQATETDGSSGAGDDVREVHIAIGGMTCAACAARVERALNSLTDVVARVNYASERAVVELPAQVPLQRLIDRVSEAGYTANRIDGARRGPDGLGAGLAARSSSLRRRLILAAILFMPLCDTSVLFSAYPSLRFAGWQALMIALAAPVVTWAAWPFYAAAARAAVHRTTTMDTLVSLGILAATGWSLYSMFASGSIHGSGLAGLITPSDGAIYLDVPAGVTTFLLAGRYFEARSKLRSGNALRALAAIGAREVTMVDDDGAERLAPVDALAVGDRFVVRPGETVAGDGRVILGEAAVDRSAMTGESRPVDVGPGAEVLGGTVSLNGRIVVEASRVGAETQLGQMLRLVEHAQSEKARVQRLADRISSVFVPAVLFVSLATLAAWAFTHHPAEETFNAAISVLIIACPCALGLATPAALLVASWSGAQLGVFFKGYRSLETSRQIDTVLLDKTGTLTEGRMTVAHSEPAAGEERDELLRAAGAVERASEHPVARAITAFAEGTAGPLPAVDAFMALPGAGARGIVGREEVYVGRIGTGAVPLEALPHQLAGRAGEWERMGHTVVAVSRGNLVIGVLALADTIRPSAGPAIARLRALGLRCVLLTGDNEETARAVAGAIGIDEVVAGALPTEKVAVIRRLQDEGRRVAMVGDGVNDAPALAAADLGLAVGSGTDVAINSADLIIVRDDLRVVASAIELARRTLRTIRGNLAWALLYNIAAIPLAALGLLDPLIAGAAMALSSSFVVWNSSRLRNPRAGRADRGARVIAAGRIRPVLGAATAGRPGAPGA